MRKIAILIVLLVGFAAFSFADTLYSLPMGISRLYEQYPDENYGRDLDGVHFDVALNHFPGKSPLGWFIRTSIGSSISGLEWKDDFLDTFNVYTSMDLRVSAGVSFKLLGGSLIQVPISFGPVVSNYREEIYSNSYYGSNGYFEAFNLGALLDLSIVVNPFKRFTIINGITAIYDFKRLERGFMDSHLRSISNSTFEEVDYRALKVSYYFGVGLRFDNSSN
ncbi:MAG: hypothetical protein FWD13_05075 [Treponema sp.]|nr:hypothetical protein [Treponema sp.]